MYLFVYWEWAYPENTLKTELTTELSIYSDPTNPNKINFPHDQYQIQ